MPRFATAISLALLGTAALSTPSEAARVLYAYTGANGVHTVSISDGFHRQGGPQPETVTCASLGAFCDHAEFAFYSVTLPFGGSQFDRDDFFISVPGAIGGAFDARTVQQTGDHESFRGVLSIRQLADSDVVYSYVDELGQSAVVISDGFYLGGETQPTLVSCFNGAQVCDQAKIVFTTFSFPGFPTLQYAAFSGDHFRSFTFHPDDFATPGVHLEDRARLAVIGPVTTAVSAVPEPETWALFLIGLGFVGAALQRRGRLRDTNRHSTDGVVVRCGRFGCPCAHCWRCRAQRRPQDCSMPIALTDQASRPAPSS